MKILLVWPNKAGFGFKPIGLALLAAVLKRGGHEVELFDTTYIDLGSSPMTTARINIRIFKPVDTSGAGLDKKQLDLRRETYAALDGFRPDVVGVSALSDEVSAGEEISAFAKEWNPAIPVIWGNKAATMAPGRILDDPNVDYVCAGEGLDFFPEFVEAVAAKRDPRRLSNIAWRDERGTVRRNPLRPF
jgi:hypothetical protein